MKVILFLSFLSLFLAFSCSEKESPTKECDLGYEYKKEWDTCIDIDECKINNGGCEENCKNNIGSFECSCENENEYELAQDGKTCIDIDECKINNAGCEQLCINIDGGFECACNDNFLLNEDKITCTDLNDCKEDSCNNQGVCIDGDDSFTCDCIGVYDGINCEECIDGYEVYGDYGFGNECVIESSIDWHSINPNIDEAEDFVIDSNDDIYVVGRTNRYFEENISYGLDDIFITKLNSNLEIQWTKQLGTDENDNTSSMIVDNDNNLYVTSKTEGIFTGSEKGDATDVTLFKMNNNGGILWKKQFVTASEDTPSDIGIDKNNNVYIIGHRKMSKLFIKKLDSDGNEIWEKETVIPGVDYYNSIAFDSQNNIYISAKTSSAVSGTIHIGSADILVLKFNESGNKVWFKQFGTEFYDEVDSIFIKNDEIYLTGYENGGTGENNFIGSGYAFFMKLDINGNILLDKIYNDAPKRWSETIIVSEDGDIYIGGHDLYNVSGRNPFLKKINPLTGETIWNKIWDDNREGILKLKIGSNNSLYSLGLTLKPENYNPFIFKIDFY